MIRNNLPLVLRSSANAVITPQPYALARSVASSSSHHIFHPFLSTSLQQFLLSELNQPLTPLVEEPQSIADTNEPHSIIEELESLEDNEGKAIAKVSALGHTKLNEKPRVVVLGSGWAGCRLMKDIDTRLYDIVCISPRDHMVFTPLLASTCIGKLDFKAVAQPLYSIQPVLGKASNSYAFLSQCTHIDHQNHEVYCETIEDEHLKCQGAKQLFKVAYDKLVIAIGAQSHTFGIHGVEENAYFLREVSHARKIHEKLLYNLMVSHIPGVTEEEKSRLLHCVVVGGGPLGVEFSGKLSNFIRGEIHLKYPHSRDYMQVTLVEANEILSSFDMQLQEYVVNQLSHAGVKLMRGVIRDVEPENLLLTDGSVIPYGLLIWSTEVGASRFVQSLLVEKSTDGRVGVDEWLQVPEWEDVYAIGDCSGYIPKAKKVVLPALARVAETQGKYLANHLNLLAKAGGGRAGSAAGLQKGEPFEFQPFGGMINAVGLITLADLLKIKAHVPANTQRWGLKTFFINTDYLLK